MDFHLKVFKHIKSKYLLWISITWKLLSMIIYFILCSEYLDHATVYNTGLLTIFLSIPIFAFAFFLSDFVLSPSFPGYFAPRFILIILLILSSVLISVALVAYLFYEDVLLKNTLIIASLTVFTILYTLVLVISKYRNVIFLLVLIVIQSEFYYLIKDQFREYSVFTQYQEYNRVYNTIDNTYHNCFDRDTLSAEDLYYNYDSSTVVRFISDSVAIVSVKTHTDDIFEKNSNQFAVNLAKYNDELQMVKSKFKPLEIQRYSFALNDFVLTQKLMTLVCSVLGSVCLFYYIFVLIFLKDDSKTNLSGDKVIIKKKRIEWVTIYLGFIVTILNLLMVFFEIYKVV